MTKCQHTSNMSKHNLHIGFVNYLCIAKLFWAGHVCCSFTKSFINNTFSFENPLDVPNGSGGSTWDVNFDFANHNAKSIQLLDYSSIATVLIWAGGVFRFLYEILYQSFKNGESRVNFRGSTWRTMQVHLGPGNPIAKLFIAKLFSIANLFPAPRTRPYQIPLRPKLTKIIY